MSSLDQKATNVEVLTAKLTQQLDCKYILLLFPPPLTIPIIFIHKNARQDKFWPMSPSKLQPKFSF